MPRIRIHRLLLVLSPWLIFAVSASAQMALKPGDKVTITITFERQLPSGASVSVSYQLLQPPRDETQHHHSFAFVDMRTSDNRTFEATYQVPTNQASGTYAATDLSVSAPDLLSNDLSNPPGVPSIAIENPQKDPKRVQIPAFKAVVK